MARPKKHELERHTHNVMVRFTDIQYEYIVDNAKNVKLTPAEYVRQQAIAGKVEMDVRIVADIEEIREIARLMANATGSLNQIAKYNVGDKPNVSRPTCEVIGVGISDQVGVFQVK